MQSMAVNGYAATDVLYALRGIRGRREWGFRYELLSATNTKIRDMTEMAGASVAHDSKAEIKRTAKFTIVDNGTIQFGSQRIKPYARLKMPDGGWAEWPLGVFLLTTPTRKIDASRVITREIDAYDQNLVLQDDKVPDRYYVSANYRYTDAVKELLVSCNIATSGVIDSTKVLPVALEWDPGTTKYKIVADLLSAVNYQSLWFDGNGVARSKANVDPNTLTAEYDYNTNLQSIILHDMDQEQDFYKVPNRLVLVVSTPDRPPLRAEIINSSPSSPTSTVSRGRTITETVSIEDVSDLPTLNDIGNTMMRTQNSLFETIKFKTGLFPIHENLDMYTFTYTGMVSNGKFQETKWSFSLEAGASMEHEAQRAVVLV